MKYDWLTGTPTPPAILTELSVVLGLAVFLMGSLTLGYHQQGYSTGAASTEPISGLMFFTLGAGLVIAAAAFWYFLRQRRNRRIAQEALADQ
jgi:hypothetical protein